MMKEEKKPIALSNSLTCYQVAIELVVKAS